MWVAHYAVGVSIADASPTAEPARIGTTGRRILLANVVAEVGIVVTGGLVRLTGSGLGCPTWPECTEGSLVPVSGQSEGLHKFIEFGNRLLTFAVLAAAVASLIVVLRPFLARHWAGRSDRWGEPGATRPTLVWLAGAVLAGIFGQALLGGVTVLLDLHPATVAAHFLLSMLMIAASFVLYRRALESADEPRIWTVRLELVWVARAIVGLAFIVLVLGTIVTGTGPHSGDADEVVRFGLDARTMSWLHADAVLVFLGLALAFTFGCSLSNAPRNARRAGLWLVVACVAQGAIGYLQYFTDLPIGLVAVHMLGACLVWLASLNVALATRTRGNYHGSSESIPTKANSSVK
jgi:cytochrome c oxidase assembly protein subunit 15